MATASSSSVIEVKLDEAFIPGAQLQEPLETHTVEALRMWLICHSVDVSPSLRKPQLITKVREAKRQGKAVIDVDGSYLYRKRMQLEASGIACAPLPLPTFPPLGWTLITEINQREMKALMPVVYPTTLYEYLAEGVGNASGAHAFRALTRGYTHWASGRLNNLEANTCNPTLCFVRCQMRPSMKSGFYTVKIILRKGDDNVASIAQATCQCAAGLSASCVHVSALLHALVHMFCGEGAPPESDAEDESAVPVTSLVCKWIQPRQQKERALKVSDAHFKRLLYAKPSKDVTSLATFDPRPPEYRGNALQHLPSLLDRLKGKGLCISLLFDPATIVNSPTSFEPLSKEDIKVKIDEFRESLAITEEDARKIEANTKEQRDSPEWFKARQFRITASLFGLVKRLKPESSPKNLVLQVLGVKHFRPTTAMLWGIEHEEKAKHVYLQYQHANGHSGLFVCASGVHISVHHPFLGASPDGSVYDLNADHPYGFLEIKCPYSQRDKTVIEACHSPSFFCHLQKGGGKAIPILKCNHPYYAQIQGQMAIGERKWCDFVVYTLQGVSVERIHFDALYWQAELLPKLEQFWHNCVAPEIIQPVNHIGLPLRDLRKE